MIKFGSAVIIILFSLVIMLSWISSFYLETTEKKEKIKVYLIDCFWSIFLIGMLLITLNLVWNEEPCEAPHYILEKNILKSQKKIEEYKEQLEKLSILNDSETKKELTEEIENNLNNEKDNFRSFFYELKLREVEKQKKELYRNLKKNDILEETVVFDGIKITDKKTGTQYIFKIEESVLEKEGE